MSPEARRLIGLHPRRAVMSASRGFRPLLRRRETNVSADGTAKAPGPSVLMEELFRSVVVRERKRVDRCAQSFALLLVSIEGAPGLDRRLWESVGQALNVSKRETDILGWFENGTSMAVLLTEIESSDAAVLSNIEMRAQRELAKRLPARIVASALSIQLHVYPATKEAWDVQPKDPIAKTVQATGHEYSYRRLKRVFDVVGSMAMLVLLSPLFVLIAALVKLTSKGPVFFEQERVGEGAKRFKMLKFRTMYTGSDHAIHHEFVTKFIKSSSQCNEPDTTAPFKLTHDPRITRVGRNLRKTSLDELPQFWNVIRGEMSLVGPRPPLPYEVDVYQPWHRRRVLEAQPGITGLWQVAGRSRTTFDEMVRLDLQYAKRRSLWTDIKILLATPRAVVAGRGAC
jgi:lipopolysaccharide/colanic/teichoic acid biosynthesis glycosyltransferase